MRKALEKLLIKRRHIVAEIIMYCSVNLNLV